MLADPGQVESALLNLAINARDAMPDGGGLVIAVANSPLEGQVDAEGQTVTPGDYVSIKVSDQGSGMPPEILAHAFEPFFTTKAVGKGSGLGLSMVYGFAKQSGGLVTIDSIVGEGTTVTLFLPRATDIAQASEWLGARDAPRGQGERILVVEDEEEVRKLTVTLLEGLGYQVVDFADARGARAALASGVKVDLILADVVLPGGISGVDFVYQVGLEQPGIKVIFMSGYAAESGRISPLLESGYAFLGKPFQRRQLAELVRDTLDGPQLPVGAADPN